MKKEIRDPTAVSGAMHIDPRMSSMSVVGEPADDVSDLREEVCLYDPEQLRLESIRGLGKQIHIINDKLLREPVGSVDQGELATCLANLG